MSRMRRNKTHYKMVGVPYIITHVNFRDDRLRVLSVAEGQILLFPTVFDRRS